MWLVAGGLLGCVMRLCFNDSFEWSGLLVAPIVLSLLSFALILPFLILSFTSSFCCERLKNLLGLPATECSPPLPTPLPVTELGSPR